MAGVEQVEGAVHIHDGRAWRGDTPLAELHAADSWPSCVLQGRLSVQGPRRVDMLRVPDLDMPQSQQRSGSGMQARGAVLQRHSSDPKGSLSSTRAIAWQIKGSGHVQLPMNCCRRAR